MFSKHQPKPFGSEGLIRSKWLKSAKPSAAWWQQHNNNTTTKTTTTIWIKTMKFNILIKINCPMFWIKSFSSSLCDPLRNWFSSQMDQLDPVLKAPVLEQSPPQWSKLDSHQTDYFRFRQNILLPTRNQSPVKTDLKLQKKSNKNRKIILFHFLSFLLLNNLFSSQSSSWAESFILFSLFKLLLKRKKQEKLINKLIE